MPGLHITAEARINGKFPFTEVRKEIIVPQTQKPGELYILQFPSMFSSDEELNKLMDLQVEYLRREVFLPKKHDRLTVMQAQSSFDYAKGLAEKLQQEFIEHTTFGVSFVRGVADLKNFSSMIEQVIQKMQQGKVVVLVVNKKYLKRCKEEIKASISRTHETVILPKLLERHPTFKRVFHEMLASDEEKAFKCIIKQQAT